MTLILLLLTLLTPSTQPVTIHTTTHQRSTPLMADGHPGAPGGGANNQNRGRAGHTTTSPGGHPPTYNPPGHGPNSTTYGRIGRDAKNPMTFTEHTARPTPHQ